MYFSSGSVLRAMLAYIRRRCSSIVVTLCGSIPSRPKAARSSRVNAVPFVYIGWPSSAAPLNGQSSRAKPWVSRFSR